MGKCVIKLDGKYMQWSSVSDSPSTPLLPEPLFKKYWEFEYGRRGRFDYLIVMRDIERNPSKDCSAIGYTANSVIKSNRAGKNEKHMTKAQIIKAFTCENEAEFDAWLAEVNANEDAQNKKFAEQIKKDA